MKHWIKLLCLFLISMITSVTQAQDVAKIGETGYATLEAAFAAANDGDKITVLANSSGNGIKAPEGKFSTNGLTVDFGGFTYTVDGTTVGSTGTETQAFQLLKNNKITFKNGTIYSEKALMLVQNYSDLTLEGMTLTLNNSSYSSAYTLSNNNGNVVIDGSTINANPAGAYAFDVCRYSSNPSVSVTVKGNSVINGDVEISASGNDAKDGFSLKLMGGELTGDIVLTASAQAAMASSPENTEVTKAADFSQDAPDGYKWVDNGNGTSSLEPCDYVAQIGTAKYETLEAAFAAAQDGETITLLKDCSGNGIKVLQNRFNNTGLTVDFAGYTYNMNGATVGSTGTETQAFQLKMNNKITFKNGTIYSENAKMLVQNYSNLTLEGMTLTLNNENYASAYTLSNNNGNVVIDGTTINANRAGAYAFDVCRFSTYPSVHVTVKGNSVINGDVEVSASGSDPKEGFSLMLESGTLNGDIVLDATAQTVIQADPVKGNVTKKDTFNQAAPTGFEWDSNGDGTSTLRLITSGSIALIDGEPYTYPSVIAVTDVTYRRTFSTGQVDKYQAWLVPMDYTLRNEDVSNFDFYKIHMIAASASETGGEVDDNQAIYIYIEKLSAGKKLNANLPYVVKPKSTGTFQFLGTTLKPANYTSRLSMSSSEWNYNFYATYDEMGATAANEWYALSGGKVCPSKNSDSKLGSYRWYIKVTDNEDNPYYAPHTFLFDDNGELTGISHNYIFDENELEGIYTVNGIKQETVTKGVNILKFKNGTTKKVYVK